MAVISAGWSYKGEAYVSSELLHDTERNVFSFVELRHTVKLEEAAQALAPAASMIAAWSM